MASKSIRITAQTDLAGDGTEAQEKQSSTSKEQDKTIAVKSIVAMGIVKQAKTLLSYSINNYGNYSGNYFQQAQIQSAISTIGDITGMVAAFAISPVSGIFMATGIVLNKSLDLASYIQNMNKANLESQKVVKRVGTILNDGSR